MQRCDLVALVQLLGLFSFAIVAYGDERLITSPGSYTTKGAGFGADLSSNTKLSLEVKSPDSEHVEFKVGWIIEEADVTGLNKGVTH